MVYNTSNLALFACFRMFSVFRTEEGQKHLSYAVFYTKISDFDIFANIIVKHFKPILIYNKATARLSPINCAIYNTISIVAILIIL